MSEEWNAVMHSESYKTMEDPFSGICVPKYEFDKVYGPACAVLFADLQVDMIFEENPVVQGEWRYADDNAREDMYDVALELGLVYSSDEVKQGESFEEERNRKETTAIPPPRLQDTIERLTQVNLLLEQKLSGKKRKKLVREQRYLIVCVDSSTESC